MSHPKRPCLFCGELVSTYLSRWTLHLGEHLPDGVYTEVDARLDEPDTNKQTYETSNQG